ncbi:M23 family metallopeptidase [Geodermatophilus marinus]|uniref:M23 family metallopeptidase n=1 Tax=Geodermatophilus sp. LHW52908 TaxID=2303986 RepID=UPI000E3BFACD|nr:M23 family metallopeptidase [Geodermatophilus sp. LHW52908]RFU21949.1 M23 family peptidase [Geodermatophilus sp. LHW52908]
MWTPSVTSRRRTSPVTGIVLAAVLLGACASGPRAPEVVGTAPAAAGPAGVSYTPLVPTVLSTPRWFEGSDGTVRIVHELQLLNAFPAPVTVTAVEVGPPGGPPLASLTGADLSAATSLMTSGGEPATTVPPSAAGVVWLDLPVPGGPSAVPERLQHTVTVSVPPELPVPGTITYTGAAVEVDRRAPVGLGPPLVGPGWVAVGSCCDGPHRRALQPINGHLTLAQRFAVDWNGVDADGRMATGPVDRNESWVFHGAPVLSVADATVVVAVDGYADQVPDAPAPVGLEEADGNHVVLDLGDGRYALYAHLAPGSVTVEPGDRVCRGQQIGRLGNSGSSSGPHLHFHVATGPTLDADGLPYVFDQFTLTGRFPVLDDRVAQLVAEGAPVPIDSVEPGVHRHQLPLGRDVVTFPPQRPAPCR